MSAVRSPVQLWRRILFWALLPISGVQGLLLRRRATRLLPPPGDNSGACGEGPTLSLLALGDSIIAGIGASEQEQTLPVQFARALASTQASRVEWHVEGENGADLESLLTRIRALDPAVQADVILLSIGVNDVTGLSSTSKWRRRLKTLLTLLQSRWPHALVVFAGLPPMGQFPLPPRPLRFSLGLRAAVFDQIAREVLSGQPRMLHIATTINPQQHSFCEDGFHPSAVGYEIWARELVLQVASAALGNIVDHR